MEGRGESSVSALFSMGRGGGPGEISEGRRFGEQQHIIILLCLAWSHKRRAPASPNFCERIAFDTPALTGVFCRAGKKATELPSKGGVQKHFKF